MSKKLLLLVLLTLGGCKKLEPEPISRIIYLPSKNHRIALKKLHEITTPDYHRQFENQTLPGSVE
jgi:hypothetical protein